jgi:hypothetical protein
MNVTTRPQRPLLSRLISLEGALAAFGLYSFGSGLWFGELIPIFWGVMILIGLGVLTAVRRRDWQKHWELVARQHSAPPQRDSEPPTS